MINTINTVYDIFTLPSKSDPFVCGFDLFLSSLLTSNQIKITIIIYVKKFNKTISDIIIY